MTHDPATIYLDNNATTRPDPGVLARVAEVSAAAWGNPGSSHRIGRRARQELESAREQIADCLDADPGDVIFTSGATESCNLAVRGLARQPGRVASIPGDHPASGEPVAELLSRGWSQRTLPLTTDGELAPLDDIDWSDVRLLTLPLAHNETGVVFDADACGRIARTYRIAWHLDATQAVGRVPVSVRKLGCSALSLSGHKLHGPRGIGAVVAGRNVNLRPQQLGGHQEAGRRAGTEAVALAAGLAEAVRIAVQTQAERTETMRTLRDDFERRLRDAIPSVAINAAAACRLPNTSSVRMPRGDGEAMLVALDLAGIHCSLGSACASGSPEPAPVLLAMGLTPDEARRSLRFSLSHDTTADELTRTVALLRSLAERAST